MGTQELWITLVTDKESGMNHMGVRYYTNKKDFIVVLVNIPG